MEIDGLPALQSFAFGEWDGKWVLIGGRMDGLHRRQPWATFDEAGQNKYLYVIDPVSHKTWKRPLKNLPVPMAEQLQSTNMQFVQKGELLYITGGYGYSPTQEDHITFPYLTVIQLPDLIKAIEIGSDISHACKQTKDQQMAVTGGRMGFLGDTLYLAGGHRFDGRYIPHGPNHGPGFIQEYTNEIRLFGVEEVNGAWKIDHFQTWHDSVNLHRRDYNLVPQISQTGQYMYTIYSGVFQYGKELPYTNIVDFSNNGYLVNNRFQQKYSHYHCAVMPLFDPVSHTMFSVFFGGIAQYYPDSRGVVIEDQDIPFTKTISVVERKADSISEWLLPIQMPGYLGASAEFIPHSMASKYAPGITDLSMLSDREMLIGYILGGIRSSAKNIFWDNSGKESTANSIVYKVYVRK